MAREFSVIVGIDATRARTGGRQFKAGADQVTRSSQRMGRSLRTANKSALSLITTIGRIRGVATLAFAGFLGVGGISSIVRTLSQFETALSKVRALLGDRGIAGSMEALEDRARSLGATTVFTATQAAEGMQFLTLAGFDALEVFEAIGPALTLAQAGALGLGEAADIVSNIMAGFKIEASDTTEVVDTLAFVAARTNTNIRQLGEAMKFVAPVAGAVGAAVQDTSVALGILGNSGLQASLAGTSLRRVMSGLLNPSKEATEVLGQMGLSSGNLVQLLGEPGGLVEVIQALSDKGLGAAEAFTLFGQRGAPGVLSLISQLPKLRDMTEAMDDIAGTAEEMARIMTDNLGGDARIAISALQEGILRLGDAGLTEFLRDTTQAFTAFIRGLAGIEQSLESSTDKVRKWASAGIFMRDNINLIRKALVVLVAFMNRAFLLTLATSVVRLAAFAVTAVRVVAGIRNMFLAVAVLTVSLKTLRAAILSTGVGALAIVVGLLIDFVLFGDDAIDTAKELANRMERLGTETDVAAFAFDKLGRAQRDLALIAVTSEIGLLEDEVKALTTQLIDGQAAPVLMKQALIDLSNAQSAVNKVTEESAESFSMAAGASDGLRGEYVALQEAQLEVNRLQELQTQNTPELQAALEILTERLELSRTRQEEWSAAIEGGFATLAEYRASLLTTGDAVEGFTEAIKKQTGLTDAQIISLQALIKANNEEKIAVQDLTKDLELLAAAFENQEVLTKAGIIKAAELATTFREVSFAFRKAAQDMTPLQKGIIDLAQRNAVLLAGEDKVKVARIEHTAALRELVLENILYGKTAEEILPLIRALKEEHEKNIETLEKACDKTEELKECMSEEAKAMEAIWDQAARNIQDAFADAFLGAFDSFSQFSDRLLGAVKRMVAELLSAKLLGGLKDIFAGIFGGGGFSIGGLLSGTASGAAGGTGLAGIGAGLATAGKGILAAAGAFLEGAKGFFKLGSGPFGASGTPGLASSLGSGLTGAAIGFASGSITDSLLGNRGRDNGTFSAIGGSIGGVLGGPLGAIIGGAIGSFVSNLLGGAKKLESAILEFSATAEGFNAVIESVTSKQKSFFRGRRFATTTEAVDTTQFDEALTALIGQLTTTAEALGVDAVAALANFDFSGTIDIRGKSEEQIAALLQNLFNNLLTGVIGEFIDNAEGLSDRLVGVVNSFRGNADEFVRAFELAASIDLAFLVDPVTVVTNALADQNKALTTSYQELVDAYRVVISEFDGSLGSLELLAAATNIVVQAQLELTAALITAGQEISFLFQDSAQSIRETLLNEEELFNLRKSQIDALVAQVGTTTDPAELQALAEEINRLGLDAFRLLDEGQQGTLGDEFIEFFEGLEDLFGDQIDLGLGAITEDNNALNQEVADTMTAAAEAQIAAAAETANAARSLQEAAIHLRRVGGGRFAELQV